MASITRTAFAAMASTALLLASFGFAQAGDIGIIAYANIETVFPDFSELSGSPEQPPTACVAAVGDTMECGDDE